MLISSPRYAMCGLRVTYYAVLVLLVSLHSKKLNIVVDIEVTLHREPRTGLRPLMFNLRKLAPTQSCTKIIVLFWNALSFK